jgi:Skp family chaperone for outer membrane proteins
MSYVADRTRKCFDIDRSIFTIVHRALEMAQQYASTRHAEKHALMTPDRRFSPIENKLLGCQSDLASEQQRAASYRARAEKAEAARAGCQQDGEELRSVLDAASVANSALRSQIDDIQREKLDAYEERNSLQQELRAAAMPSMRDFCNNVTSILLFPLLVLLAYLINQSKDAVVIVRGLFSTVRADAHKLVAPPVPIDKKTPPARLDGPLQPGAEATAMDVGLDQATDSLPAQNDTADENTTTSHPGSPSASFVQVRSAEHTEAERSLLARDVAEVKKCQSMVKAHDGTPWLGVAE